MTEPARLTAHATETDHEGTGLALLARQFTKPRIEALIRAVLAGVQVVENDVWALYALAITNSSDAALDQIGSLLLQPRPDAMTDAVYRKVLRGVVLALKSSGTGDEIEAVAHVMLGSYPTLTERFPAAVIVEPTSSPDVPAAVLASVLGRTRSAGVGLQVVDVPAGDLFAFSADAELPSTDADTGFSDTSGVVGGSLVGVIAA